MTNPWANIPSAYLTVDQEEPLTGPLARKLRAWLRRRLKTEVQNITQRTGGGGGYKSTIYFAETSLGPLVIRVPKLGWNEWLVDCPDFYCVAGAYAIELLRKLQQPVPELLAIEQDKTIFGAPFAVLRRVPGIHMADYSSDWTSWPYPEEQFGEFLRACHSITHTQGVGPLDDSGTGWCSSWSEYVARVILLRAAQYAELLPRDFCSRWERFLEHYAPLLESWPVRMLQLESTGYCNLILDPATHDIKAVLDYEEVLAGDPLFEFVIMAWYLGRRVITDHGDRTCFNWRRFYRGYGKVDWQHPLVPIYRTAMLLEKLYRPDGKARAGRLTCMLDNLERPILP